MWRGWYACWGHLLLEAKGRKVRRIPQKNIIHAHQMVHAYVDPSHQILLCQVLAVEEVVEVDHRETRQVHVPHTTGRRLGLLTTGHSKIVPSPVRVVEEAFGPDDSLYERESAVLYRA